jgi:hypothetical protein
MIALAPDATIAGQGAFKGANPLTTLTIWSRADGKSARHGEESRDGISFPKMTVAVAECGGARFVG